jgi:hypothetical protein
LVDSDDLLVAGLPTLADVQCRATFHALLRRAKPISLKPTNDSASLSQFAPLPRRLDSNQLFDMP